MTTERKKKWKEKCGPRYEIWLKKKNILVL